MKESSPLRDVTLSHLLHQISEIKKLEQESGKSESTALNATLKGVRMELRKIKRTTTHH